MTYFDAKGTERMTIESFEKDIEAAEEREPEARAEDVATYIADMSGDLSMMARSAGLDLLAYFLDMALMEARARSGRADVN
jgi:hypothetical protein